MKKLLLFLFTTVLSLNAMAQDDYSIVTNILPPSGKQYINNTNITWEVDGDWTLTISGEGEMPNYTTASAPWHNATCTQETKIYLSGNCLYTNTVEVTQKLQIKKIIIDKGITHIGNYAFFSLDDLTSVEIPSTLTSIGEDAFNGCTELSTLTGDCNFSTLTIEQSAFSGTKLINKENGALYIGNKLIRVFSSYQKNSISIDKGTTEICANAFKGNQYITSITIPESVTKIGNDAFNGCTNLYTFILEGNNVTFGTNVFNGCTSLPHDGTYRKAGDKIIVEVFDTDNENYKIPSDVIYIAENAFTQCSNIKTIESYNSSTPALGAYALYNYNSPYLYVIDGQESKFFGKGIADNRINHTVINLHSSGYSTIALRHSANVPNGIEAYTVTTDGSKISYNRAYKLAKGEGYFIVGSGDKTFAAAKTNVEEQNENHLVGVLKAEGEQVTGPNYYFLSTNKAGVTGFYSLGNNTYTFPAGKAYLLVGGTNNAPYFLMNFDDIETGIESTEEEGNSNARSAIYNLAGQKLSKAQKGLNVVNGKLTIM